ncbi:MAG: MarR family transcriptional regulator [Chthoniobacterales bacterium]
MRTVTVDLDDDDVKFFTDALRIRRANAVQRRDEADREIEEIDRKIARLNGEDQLHLGDEPQSSRAANDLAFTATGRVQRGQSERVVTEFMKSRNGTGASIKEITKATGTKYGTVHRILTGMATLGWVTRTDDARWQWGLPQ